MTLRSLTEHHLAFIGLKGDCTGSSESTLIKMPHCWKSHVAVHIDIDSIEGRKISKLTSRKKNNDLRSIQRHAHLHQTMTKAPVKGSCAHKVPTIYSL